jgi:hypothetical protein
MTNERDRRLKEAWDTCDKTVICDLDYKLGFVEGWDAQEEEVRELREDLSVARQSLYEIVEQRNLLFGREKRLIDEVLALWEAFDDTAGDWDHLIWYQTAKVLREQRLARQVTYTEKK